MTTQRKTKQQLIEEADALRRQVAELEAHMCDSDLLNQSGDLLQAVIDGTSDAVYVKDTEGRYVMINSAGAGYIGRAAEEIVGRTDAELFSAETGRRIMEQDRAIMASGTHRTLEETAVAGDGTARTYLTTKGVQRDSSGHVVGLFGISHDITARKSAEQVALEQNRARLRQIIDVVPHMIFVKDLEGRFLLVNRAVAEAYGTTVDELTGRPHGDVHRDARELERMLADDREVIRSGEPKYIVREEFVDVRGQRRVLQTVKIPYKLSGNEQPAVLGLAIDITEQERSEREKRALEERVQQAQRVESLGVLASGIAHDFNELVMQILGNAALARAMRMPTQEGRALLENIERAARAAADLTNQLRVYAGEVRFETCALFVNRLIEDTAHLLEAVVSRSAELRYELAPDLPPLMADPSQLQQVLLNLVTNASETVGEKGGVITISTDLMEADSLYLASCYMDAGLPVGTYETITVSDDGPGMDPDVQARMFDPFFSTKYTGGGLGLAAVLGIVRGHNGTIRVDSAPGRGTRVRVLLPLPPHVEFIGAGRDGSAAEADQ